MSLKDVRVLLNFGHTFCLFPVRVELVRNRTVCKSEKFIACFIARALLIDALIIALLAEHSVSILERVDLNAVVFVACSFPIVIAIVEAQINSIISRKRLKKLLRQLGRLEGPHKNSHIAPILLILCFVYFFAIYFVYYSPGRALIINFGFTVSKFMLLTASCIFYTFLRILHAHFQHLNSLLAQKNNPGPLLHAYSDLTAICRQLNRLYDRHLVLTLLTYFIWSIYEMYHLVILLSIGKGPDYLILLASSYTVVQEVTIFGILYMCQRTGSEAEAFKRMWFKMEDVRHGARSMKLLHFEVKFTAMGLYRLDSNHFFSMMGSLVTLIAILTQFTKF